MNWVVSLWRRRSMVTGSVSAWCLWGQAEGHLAVEVDAGIGVGFVAGIGEVQIGREQRPLGGLENESVLAEPPDGHRVAQHGEVADLLHQAHQAHCVKARGRLQTGRS